MILLNPHHESIKFYMPRKQGTAWEVMLDSAIPGTGRKTGHRAGRTLRVDRAQYRPAAGTGRLVTSYS